MLYRRSNCLLWMSRAVGLFCLGAASSTVAQDGTSIVRIEEDWELQVLQPNEQLDAPQITTAMLPFGAESDLLFEVDWNHASVPAFSNGGFQVRVSADGESLIENHVLAGQRLVEAEETIRWTQVVHKSNGGYTFFVINGLGASWGSFGGSDSSVFVTSQDVAGDLNAYRSSDSVANSGVTYAGNRVTRMRLKRVRFVNDLGQTWQVEANADVE